jgi:hypothetical protein
MGTNFPMGYITQGRDFNYFNKVTISSAIYGGSNTAFYLPDGYQDGYSPDALITFPTYGIILLNETASSVVRVSYNGQTDHDELNTTITTANAASFEYDNRVVSAIWFRLVSGGAATVSIRAWAIR